MASDTDTDKDGAATAAAVIISISGPSSSGKTTISRLLRDLFPSMFILHQDDFYKPESELPTKNGFADWDCAESLNLADMDAALAHIRTHGEIPPWLKSKEDQNAVGPVPISPSFIHSQKLRVESWLRTLPPSPGCCPKICLVDGFLLYTPALDRVTRHVQSHARLLLLASRERVFARRAARTGYVTLEGFWADPPGYVERVVWPNYVDAHGWLFEDGNVEGGRLDREVLKRAGIEAVEAQEGDDGDDADVDLERVLEWAVGRVMRAVDEFAGRSDGSEV